MTVSVDSFRVDFPAFADTTAYPNAAVSFWLALAGKMLIADRWAEVLDIGIELYIAHNLALEQQGIRAAANGGIPGQASGVVTGKTVDKVSVNYDATAGIEENAGNWNLTIYGMRFINLARMIGAGPLVTDPAW